MSPEDLAAQLEQLHAAAFGWALSCCGWDRASAEDVIQIKDALTAEQQAKLAAARGAAP